MMYKLICILKCLTLVATNPLQGLQSCSQVQYVQSYGQPDGPLITSTNYVPYQQQLVVQNEMTPTIQTIPYLHDEQISRLYYKVQPSPVINTFADVNTHAYDQNGVDITRYVSNPATATPNVVNNYIIVPPEYFKFNQSDPNENLYFLYQKKEEDDNDVKINDSTQKEKHKKKKRNENSVDRHNYIDNYNYDTPTSDKQSDDVPKKKAKRKESKKNKSKRKSSKKNKNKGEGLESLKGIDENDVEQKPDKQRNQSSKVKALENKNDKETAENIESKTKKRKSDDGSKVANKKNKRKKTLKPSQEKPMESQPKEDLHDDINLNISPNENTKKTADIDVCFDINEECGDLEIRRTRNNCCDRKCNNNNHHHHHHNNNQQNMQRDCPANIASYLNSIMSMPQLNTNYFNPMGNFPYNFNYLYQIPPQSNTKSNESNKKRKKGKKKQKANNSNTDEKHCTNQSPVEEVTSDDCEKVVELTPLFIEIEQINEPIISEVTSQNVEKIENKTAKDSETEEFDSKKRVIEPIENNKPKVIELLPELIELPSEVTEPSAKIIEPLPEIIEPPTEIIKQPKIYITDDSEETLYVAPEEHLYVAPVLDEENIPYFYENDANDEYYPDFTSDNIYLSKEDYEFNNFHDRYYYSSDNRAEMSREKRRYEHVKGKKMRKSNDVHNNKQKVKNTKDIKSTQQHKDTLKDKENSSEVKFRIPPPLEFPDFKTEMVNRHRDESRVEHEYIKNAHKNDMPKDDDQDNEIETVYAHSKVATYGASPNTKETSLFDLTPTIDAEKILLSRDGDTTVVIARSLGYPDDY